MEIVPCFWQTSDGYETGKIMREQKGARILSTSVGEDCFLMRYGGDEFLIIAPSGENSYEEKILEAAGRCHSLPFPLGLSIGSLQVTAEENRSLAEWIHEADQRMYEVKKKKKAMADGQIDS